MKTFIKKPPRIPHPEIKKSCFLPELKIIHHQMKPQLKTGNNALSLININRKFNNKDSITWYRHKCNKAQIINSINDLIVTPRQSSFPINPQKKTNSNQPICSKFSRSKSFQKDRLLINVKYLFTNEKFKKILKLKELFLDFDFDNNKIMELDEIQSMFTMNNIKVNKSDLTKLFFKDINNQRNKKKEKELYLNFFQFIQFCLSQNEEFRNFMKNLKEENKNDHDFLPLNFNILLDHFIDKGEERKCLKKIHQALISMDRAIEDNVDCYINDLNLINKQKEDINFYAIIKEFERLFVLTKNRGKTTKRQIRPRSTSKDKRKKSLKSLRESHGFGDINESNSNRNKESVKIATVKTLLPKRSNVQFKFSKENELRCYSSKNTSLF